jgi:hypothetical protein
MEQDKELENEETKTKEAFLSIPLARVKRIIHSDREVNKVSAEATFLIAKSTVRNF